MCKQGTAAAWAGAQPAEFIRWFTDGEWRDAKALWQLASIRLQPGEAHPAYKRRGAKPVPTGGGRISTPRT
ncbi:MAG: hypothetical protein HC910_16465 [Spirulinaceae cyanobacterium SM2_1_0]|nr:hypothetical protein [Spirulinaceae cyanobacterium SM2_1_0]